MYEKTNFHQKHYFSEIFLENKNYKSIYTLNITTKSIPCITVYESKTRDCYLAQVSVIFVKLYKSYLLLTIRMAQGFLLKSLFCFVID